MGLGSRGLDPFGFAGVEEGLCVGEDCFLGGEFGRVRRTGLRAGVWVGRASLTVPLRGHVGPCSLRGPRDLPSGVTCVTPSVRLEQAEP